MREEKTIRARVLVKAYPQPSEQYGETVCVAAITEDGAKLLRLYPIRFRNLEREQRFKRWDLIEANVWRDTRDTRPESLKVIEDSLRLSPDPQSLDRPAQVRLWHPHVSESFAALRKRNKADGTSLGIIKPDPESVRFTWEPIEKADDEERGILGSLHKQQSLIERPVKPLPAPEFVFRYAFKSGEKPSRMKIHDWEVQATFNNYRRTYGSTREALQKMRDYYERQIPSQNLHLIMGTMKRYIHQFIIIGVLRTSVDVPLVTAQADFNF